MKACDTGLNLYEGAEKTDGCYTWERGEYNLLKIKRMRPLPNSQLNSAF